MGDLAAAMQRRADITDDGLYRYSLSRVWDDRLPTVAFVMLNSSVADRDRDDPTVRRCIGFARSWGYGAIDVTNLYAYIATDPRDLEAAARRGVNVIGPDNDRILEARLLHAPLVVAAWGSHRLARQRANDLVRKWPDAIWHCLGTTKDGCPRHPLYVAGDAQPVPWARSLVP